MRDVSNFYNLPQEERELLMQPGEVCINEEGNIVTKGEQLKKYMEELLPCAYGYLKSIIRDIERKELPYVISIEGGFGSGKTHFVTRLCQYIRDTGTKAIYFNAFEYDTIAPKIAILDAILKNEQMGTVERFFKKIVDRVNVSMNIPFLGLSFSMSQNGLYFKNEMDKIKALLKEEIKKNDKIVLILDELDRCDPRFALNLLETLKHFFDLDGLFIILTFCDKALLAALSNIYGEAFINSDSENYLTKFIDHRTKIYETDIDSYAIAVGNCFSENNCSMKKNQINSLSAVFYSNKLSIREVRRCIERIISLLKSRIVDYDLILYSYVCCRYDRDFTNIEATNYLQGNNKKERRIFSKRNEKFKLFLNILQNKAQSNQGSSPQTTTNQNLYESVLNISKKYHIENYLSSKPDMSFSLLRRDLCRYYKIICKDSGNARKLADIFLSDLYKEIEKILS